MAGRGGQCVFRRHGQRLVLALADSGFLAGPTGDGWGDPGRGRPYAARGLPLPAEESLSHKRDSCRRLRTETVGDTQAYKLVAVLGSFGER